MFHSKLFSNGFVMIRDWRGFYTYTVLERWQGWPNFDIQEARILYKLQEELSWVTYYILWEHLEFDRLGRWVLDGTKSSLFSPPLQNRASSFTSLVEIFERLQFSDNQLWESWDLEYDFVSFSSFSLSYSLSTFLLR